MKLIDLLDETGLSDKELAKSAKISEPTLRKMKTGQIVSRRKLGSLLRALSKELGRRISFEDIEDVLTD